MMRVGLVLLSLVIILTFQNCILVDNGIFESSSSTQSLSGNGGGYDGKLSYYRFIPNYTCEGQETYKDRLVVDEDGYWLIENNKDQNNCSQTKTQLSEKDLNFSPFQKTFIGAKDFLYANYKLDENKIPELLAEGMCRDDWENPTFEILTHYNYRTGEAKTEIFELDTNGKISSKVSNPTLRVLSNKYVKYSLFDGQMEFEINFTVTNGEYNRKYSGSILKMDNSSLVSVKKSPLTCITGGGLDRSIWPLKKIDINPTVIRFFSHPSRDEFYFTDRSNYNPNCYVPFVKRNDGQIEDIGQQLMGAEMCAFDMYPIDNTDYIAVPGNKSGGYYWGTTVYVYNPIQPEQSHRLVFNNNQSSSNINNFPSIASKIFSNGDGNLVYLMKKNNALSSTSVSVDTYYRIYNLETKSHKDYLKTTDQNASYEFSFNSSESKSKINYASYVLKDAQEIYSFKYLDLANFTEHNFPLNIPESCSLSNGQFSYSQRQQGTPRQFYVSKNYKKLLVQIKCENPYSELVQIYDLLSGQYIKSVKGRAFWNARFPDLLYTINFLGIDPLNLKYDPTSSKITELDTLHSYPIRLDYQYYIPNEYLYENPLTKITYAHDREYIYKFTESSKQYLIGFTSLPDQQLRLHDLTTHQEINICENFQGYPMRIEKIREDLIVLVTMQPEEFVNIYKVQNSKECTLLNSSPTKRLLTPAAFVTNQGIGVVLRMTTGASLDSTFDELPDEVVYISFDGRTPLYLNFEDQETAYITSIQLSKDLSKLYLLGKSNLRIRETNFYWLPIIYF